MSRVRAIFSILMLAGHAQIAAGSEVAFVHRASAKAHVLAVCVRLAQESGGSVACPARPVTIKLKAFDDAPRAVEAYFTMPDGPAGGCTITVVPRALKDLEVLAHEACHCAHDRRDVGKRGWLISDAGEIEAREARARACAASMVGRT